MLGYTWLFTENAYLDDVFRFYNEKVYEKEILFELLKYEDYSPKYNKGREVARTIVPNNDFSKIASAFNASIKNVNK